MKYVEDILDARPDSYKSAEQRSLGRPKCNITLTLVFVTDSIRNGDIRWWLDKLLLLIAYLIFELVPIWRSSIIV